LNLNVLIDPCDGFIRIGDNVIIGPNCVLRAADHIYSDITKAIKFQGHRGGHIIIEDNCWLGANVVVLKDVTIGKGSIIGAGAVVTRDIPPNSIAVGVPARVMRSR
jgi:acetyltransferase-like isoleucine patch superfamily enzyme